MQKPFHLDFFGNTRISSIPIAWQQFCFKLTPYHLAFIHVLVEFSFLVQTEKANL